MGRMQVGRAIFWGRSLLQLMALAGIGSGPCVVL